MSEERPKGIIGQWYTLTTYFDGIGETPNRKAGYTWRCESLDFDGEPMIDKIPIGFKEGYRLATREEIARAKGEQVADQVTEQPKPSKEAREFWERVFCTLLEDSSLSGKDCVELADKAMAEWQKRFEP